MRWLAPLLLSLALASPALAHNTWPYPNGRCPAASSCAIGSTSTTSIMFTTDGTKLDLGRESNVLTLIATGGGPAIFRGADSGGPANTLYDTTGAGAITVGSADVTSVTVISDGGTVVIDGTVTSDANDMGWAVVAGGDTACTTTCTSACVFGVNTAAANADIVDCADATADECLCAGAS